MTQAEAHPSRRSFLFLLFAILAPVPVVLFRWYRRPSTLSIAVEGPFPSRKAFSLGRFTSPIVEPVLLTILDAPPDYGEADLDVHFRFKGPESSTRIVKVRVTIRDSNGHVMYRHSQNCRDNRYFAKLPRPGRIQLLPENHAIMAIPQDVAKRAARIDLVFQNI